MQYENRSSLRSLETRRKCNVIVKRSPQAHTFSKLKWEWKSIQILNINAYYKCKVRVGNLRNKSKITGSVQTANVLNLFTDPYVLYESFYGWQNWEICDTIKKWMPASYMTVSINNFIRFNYTNEFVMS